MEYMNEDSDKRKKIDGLLKKLDEYNMEVQQFIAQNGEDALVSAYVTSSQIVESKVMQYIQDYQKVVEGEYLEPAMKDGEKFTKLFNEELSYAENMIQKLTQIAESGEIINPEVLDLVNQVIDTYLQIETVATDERRVNELLNDLAQALQEEGMYYLMPDTTLLEELVNKRTVLIEEAQKFADSLVVDTIENLTSEVEKLVQTLESFDEETLIAAAREFSQSLTGDLVNEELIMEWLSEFEIVANELKKTAENAETFTELSQAILDGAIKATGDTVDLEKFMTLDKRVQDALAVSNLTDSSSEKTLEDLSSQLSNAVNQSQNALSEAEFKQLANKIEQGNGNAGASVKAEELNSILDQMQNMIDDNQVLAGNAEQQAQMTTLIEQAIVKSKQNNTEQAATSLLNEDF